jgi:malonyl CoA-acyl carrier protein transacylase
VAPARPDNGLNAVGFFSGLGSRSAYREAGRASIGSTSDRVTELYRQAAEALQLPNGADGLTLTAANLPGDPVERQGFIGAAFLVHNLAIHAHLHDSSVNSNALKFAAYTGESFGVLAAAVAGGSLGVRDGVLLAHVFAPLLLAAANQRARGPLGASLERYLPRYSPDRPPVGEPAHVVGLKGEPAELEAFLLDITQRYGNDDIEVHKRYSPRQVNVYVRAGFIATFVQAIRAHPGIKARELKEPTKFLAHSRKMTRARQALDRYMDEQNLVFADPHTPVISNSGGGFLITGEQVRNAVLDMTNQVIDSRRTVDLINELHPDLVIEIGLGGKSLDLLSENTAQPATMAVTNAQDASELLHGAEVFGKLKAAMREDQPASHHGLRPPHEDLLRDVINLATHEPAFDEHLQSTVCKLALDVDLHPERDTSVALRQMRETLQYTLAHRRHIDDGELVIGARLKKRLDDQAGVVGEAYTELRVLDAQGKISDRAVSPAQETEALVVHFEKPRRSQTHETARAARDLVESQAAAERVHDAIPDHLRAPVTEVFDSVDLKAATARADAVDLIVHQVSMFELLKQHRPGLFTQSHVFLEGGDTFGWLIALVASGAADPGDVIELGTQVVLGRRTDARTKEMIDRLCGRLRDSTVPLLSTTGSPVSTRHDLQAETIAFCRRTMDKGPRPIRLDASCTILTLTSSTARLAKLDVTPYTSRVVAVRNTDELWQRGVNRELDTAEALTLLASSAERRTVMRYARERNLLHSTVSAYINPGESLVGFGRGGSESLTLFFRRQEGNLLVRKVLSETLTATKWDPNGEGAMLPPFAKAKRQAEYLMALPICLRDYFPQVSSVVERELHLPNQASGERAYRELIYEMSFVPGEEVSQYVKNHIPPPAVVARLYEQIMKFIHRNVHSKRRVVSPGCTLEEQYFRKIEDRLNLCRRTAPKTFSPELLDTDEILINGRRYRNYRRLLEIFRTQEEFKEVLEPRFHALVVGDTNTENIKIGYTRPLVRAQELIESGASRAVVARALTAITPETIELRFLDPRAIGFRSEGADTRDDPMYDNKVWHNSIGHYDEIHNEEFDLTVARQPDGTPNISIAFHDANPYQRSYRVRDTTEHNLPVRPNAPQGIEDHFARVMRNVYDLDDPTSTQYQVDPNWITRFVFTMGTHFAAMPPFHFQSEINGALIDSPDHQRRPIAIYCEGIKWLNWSLEILEGTRADFLGIDVSRRVEAPKDPTDTSASKADVR